MQIVRSAVVFEESVLRRGLFQWVALAKAVVVQTRFEPELGEVLLLQTDYWFVAVAVVLAVVVVAA